MTRWWLAGRVPLRIAYLLMRWLFGLVVLVFRGDRAKDAELLVLRHENAVLRRTAGRVRYEPADRAWFAALAQFIPRRQWAEVFPVTPATLLAWHRRLAARKYDTSTLCRAKTGPWALSWRFVLSSCSAVLADQASDGMPVLDPGSDIDGRAGFVQWRSLLPSLMRPVGIVMSRVIGQDAPEMLLAVDQHVIEALAAQRAHIPLRESICPR